ncbi:MAG: integrase family protein [Nitrosomonas sp.]|uniref:tyrosine-type recombinase/integrase n=1 Tax=Nitrosomonas sp. TaxID=42353 RepID=UPI00273288DC|nr:integrase family protein [Nitrosomonas sp.]MDP3279956.1 integrase family protein [Nitrosomonas sp.]MDP3663843.1 integrase family protein [Nitrosomonas sp.]MDZ4105661.1 integrase family protein [Nitrosomonas sp.]
MKINKKNFTTGVITKAQCDPGKNQAIFYDAKTPGLGLRVTGAGVKAYIFETRLNGKTLRLTIGDVRSWTLAKAQDEAARLKVMVNQGIDPRQVKADQAAATTAATIAKKAQETRETMTVSAAWVNYLDYQKDKMQRSHIERGKRWGARHLKDHENLSQAGGIEKQRGKGLTKPGVLYPLLQMRMIDINADVLKEWQKQEAETRANNARQGYEMFRAFWRWCASRPEYTNIIDVEAVESKELRDEVPSRKSKRFDVMQRAHLPSWFAAVRSLENPVISAYLQGLLLLGCRREELAGLRWEDVDFRWGSIWIKDKIREEGRKVPLSPYFSSLLTTLPRRNQWVFSSLTAANGRIIEARIPHNRALSIAGLPPLTLHGLRRTFASLAEWVEMPRGIVAQIMGHAPSATAERHYINRPLELLAVWHGKYEEWTLKEAGIEFKPGKAGLTAIK